jgi:hypothetical protein
VKRLIALAALALAAVLAFPGTASANNPQPRADCDGLEFNMDRTEDGTQVFATRNGQTVADVRNDVFGAPVRFTVPSPDRTVTQTWRVTVIGRNGTLRWSETVAPCVVPTTASTTVPPVVETTSTTVPPVVVTTVPAVTVPATTTTEVTRTTVAVAPPPAPSTPITVILPPRPAPPTTVPAVLNPPNRTGWVLPDTGGNGVGGHLLGIGLCVSLLGFLFWQLSRVGRG